MAIEPGRTIPKQPSVSGSVRDDEEVAQILGRAAEADGYSRAPEGLAVRISAAAMAEPARRPQVSFSAEDFAALLLGPRVIGASFVSFSVGAAVAVVLIDMRASALITSLMLGVARSVTTGGFL